jgi:branched-chain amino acid transport system permease protein
VPNALGGVINLGFMILPIYRAWVIAVSIAVCFSTWFVIERTRLGATLRAARENAPLLQAFGVNVPLLFAATYGGGVALAALAGVLSAPVILVTSQMGSSLVIVVLGIIEGFTKVIYPEASNIVVFVIMAIVLIVRPAGLFGRE